MWVPFEYLLATHSPPWLLDIQKSLRGTFLPRPRCRIFSTILYFPNLICALLDSSFDLIPVNGTLNCQLPTP
jgi:hypothetical protein